MTDIICAPPARPGGFELTERGVALCGFQKNDRLADIGCGGGETVRYLSARHGFSVTGIDISPPAPPECGVSAASPLSECGVRAALPLSECGVSAAALSPHECAGETPESSPVLLTADAKALPFPDASLDGLLFECSMSKMEPPDAVLCECARVLRPGGRLMVSDLYARGEPAVLRGLLGRVERRETLLARAGIYGFELAHFEDHSDALTALWANLALTHGAAALCQDFGADADTLRRIKCGYYLAVFQKSAASPARTEAWTGVLTGQGRAPTAEGTRAWQLAQLKRTLEYAAAGGFYRAFFEKIRLAEIQSFRDFEALPFTTADDLGPDGARFLRVSPNDVKRIVTQRSSGTSGVGKRLYFTEGDILRTEEFFTYALSDYVRSGQRAMVFLSNDTEDGIGDLLRRAFRRIGVEAALYGGISDFGAAAAAARGFDFFIGMPAQMLRLCRTAPALAPRGVLLSADYIPARVVSALRETWGCRVIRHFGMTETCFGCAADCADGGGQHIRHADFYLEIIGPESGKPVPCGQCGEIVLTTLRSEALPLIRYRTGDLGCLEGGVCACGGTLPRLGRVLGRIENLKTRVNIHALDELLFSFPGVRDYAAELAGGALSLTVEGAKINAAAVAEAFGVAVVVKYGSPPPCGGKRRLFGGPPP